MPSSVVIPKCATSIHGCFIIIFWVSLPSIHAMNYYAYQKQLIVSFLSWLAHGNFHARFFESDLQKDINKSIIFSLFNINLRYDLASQPCYILFMFTFLNFIAIKICLFFGLAHFMFLTLAFLFLYWFFCFMF